ncbi:MAG TPA: hypothetical protein VF791_01040 [Pyrinomonadaceae bacterium]
MMQTAQITLKQYGQGAQPYLNESAAPLSNWLTRLFGCWHREMSRPFTIGGESYRVCLDCGARRKFDPRRWEMVGAYYFKPATQL